VHESETFPYTGPVVDVPDMGPDSLDEHGKQQETKAPPPLTSGRARELYNWSIEWAATQQIENPSFTTADLEAELRGILHDEVMPDELEAAIKQVIDLVFAT